MVQRSICAQVSVFLMPSEAGLPLSIDTLPHVPGETKSTGKVLVGSLDRGTEVLQSQFEKPDFY